MENCIEGTVKGEVVFKAFQNTVMFLKLKEKQGHKLSESLKKATTAEILGH